MRIEKGFPVGADGRTHPHFTHNPSSLRFSCVNPNLQNIPRGNDSEVQKWVKECFVAPSGSLFWERDFSAIEAVLVGYFAGAPDYIRFAKLGVHAYLASHIAGRPASLDWSDTDLRGYFKALKRDEPVIYDTAKRVVHLSNYMGTPRKMHYEYPETFKTIKSANNLQGLYFDLFPAIKSWHVQLCLSVDAAKRRPRDMGVEDQLTPWSLGVCQVKNPFGYVHRFYNVLDWSKEPVGEDPLTREVKYDWRWHFGEDAKRLASILPQSTAAAIIKKAAKGIWYQHRDPVGESLRLLIHDSIFGESRKEAVEECLEVSRVIMEAPIPELPLDPTWGMGEFLTVGSEAKIGKSWAEMH